MNEYQVQATLTIVGRDGSRTTRQVPTFTLDRRTLGIVDLEHAARIAADVVLSADHDESAGGAVVSVGVLNLRSGAFHAATVERSPGSHLSA